MCRSRETPPKDNITAVLDLQSAIGQWRLCGRLYRALGHTRSTIPIAPEGVKDWRWATALAVIFLRRRPDVIDDTYNAYRSGINHATVSVVVLLGKIDTSTYIRHEYTSMGSVRCGAPSLPTRTKYSRCFCFLLETVEALTLPAIPHISSTYYMLNIYLRSSKDSLTAAYIKYELSGARRGVGVHTFTVELYSKGGCRDTS